MQTLSWVGAKSLTGASLIMISMLMFISITWGMTFIQWWLQYQLLPHSKHLVPIKMGISTQGNDPSTPIIYWSITAFKAWEWVNVNNTAIIPHELWTTVKIPHELWTTVTCIGPLLQLRMRVELHFEFRISVGLQFQLSYSMQIFINNFVVCHKIEYTNYTIIIFQNASNIFLERQNHDLICR
jgi:hypothetical protein